METTESYEFCRLVSSCERNLLWRRIIIWISSYNQNWGYFSNISCTLYRLLPAFQQESHEGWTSELPFLVKCIGTRFFFFFNSSLLWDVFIINSVEQLQTLPKTQSEIDISPFLKTFVFLEMGLYRSRIEFCVFRNGLISISDWVFGNVWSCSTLFIIKTSHKSDELKKK